MNRPNIVLWKIIDGSADQKIIDGPADQKIIDGSADQKIIVRI